MNKDFTFSELPVTVDSDEVNVVYIYAHQAASQPVAMLRLDVDKTSSPGWIGPLFVAEGQRGLGLGTALLERAFEVAQRFGLKTVGLSVKRTNEGARRLYDRLGFVPYLTGHEGHDQLIKLL